jgi:hypothetical protein
LPGEQRRADQPAFVAVASRHDQWLLGPTQHTRPHGQIESRDQRACRSQAAAHRHDRRSRDVDDRGERVRDQFAPDLERACGGGIALRPCGKDRTTVLGGSVMQMRVQTLDAARAAGRLPGGA